MKKRKFTALIQNRNGVLTRLIGLVAKHQFSIESLTVECTDVEGVSKMAVLVDVGNDHKFMQLLKQINKQIDVLFVSDASDQNIVVHELALIKEQSDGRTF